LPCVKCSGISLFLMKLYETLRGCCIVFGVNGWAFHVIATLFYEVFNKTFSLMAVGFIMSWNALLYLRIALRHALIFCVIFVIVR
jgi:hypothetical protein